MIFDIIIFFREAERKMYGNGLFRVDDRLIKLYSITLITGESVCAKIGIAGGRKKHQIIVKTCP